MDNPSTSRPINFSPFKITRIQSSLQKGIINLFYGLWEESMEEGVHVPQTHLITRVAKLLQVGVKSVENIVNKHKKEEALTTPKKSRKRKCTVTDIDNFTKDAIANKIYSSLSAGLGISIKSLFKEIKGDDGDTLNFQGSQTSLRRVVKGMGFTWGKGDRYAHLRESDAIIFKRECFLRYYIRNKNSSTPKTVVFLDETWIYMNGGGSKTWVKENEVRGHPKRPDEGSRFVVVHAGTKHGFVQGASLIFSTDLKRGQDYHGSMNSEKFERWVQEQLVPGIENLGSCLIVLDNASYHSRLLEENPTSRWKKNELVSWLQQHGVEPPTDATVVLLRQLCKLHSSQLKRYVVDKLFEDKGHQVLRLPPYHCFFNAIEQVWSETKRYYSKVIVSRSGSGIERTKQVWEEALNQVTPQKWNNYVDHTEKIINEYWIKEIQQVPQVDDIIINLEETFGESDNDSEGE